MNEKEWASLVDSIVRRNCTPFLGAGIGVPALSTGVGLAKGLARDSGYPFRDTHNLPRVSQYIATSHRDNPGFAKGAVVDWLRHEMDAVAEIPVNYRRLAQLGLPIYVTTNYDDFLSRGLPAQPTRRVVSRWNRRVFEEHGEFNLDPPTAEAPLVFYMHGHVDHEASILLTEDDYVEFVVSLARDTDEAPRVIPSQVTQALCWTQLLFIGYSLEDWNFRVLMRSLMNSADRRQAPRGLSIQLEPDKGMIVEHRYNDLLKDAVEFVADYLNLDKIDVEWVKAGDFLEELVDRVAIKRGSN